MTGTPRPLRQLVDCLLEKVRATIAVRPAVEIARDVLQRLALADRADLVTQSPPSCLMASSNVSRVRNDGFSNRRLKYFPVRDLA